MGHVKDTHKETLMSSSCLQKNYSLKLRFPNLGRNKY